MPEEDTMESSLCSRFPPHRHGDQGGSLEWVLWIFMFGAIFLMLGCAGYQDKYPSLFQKVEGEPNTFRMSVVEFFGLFEPKERVREIRVFESKTDAGGVPVGQLCWEIVATPPVIAEGFQVVVGQTPQGFIQVFPPSGETFKPIPSKGYEITVTMNHPSAWPLGARTSWIGE